MLSNKMRHRRTEAQEWCFRLMNDPEYFEKWRYKDTINDHSKACILIIAISAS
jgi:hypothetical protein